MTQPWVRPHQRQKPRLYNAGFPQAENSGQDLLFQPQPAHLNLLKVPRYCRAAIPVLITFSATNSCILPQQEERMGIGHLKLAPRKLLPKSHSPIPYKLLVSKHPMWQKSQKKDSAPAFAGNRISLSFPRNSQHNRVTDGGPGRDPHCQLPPLAIKH